MNELFKSAGNACRALLNLSDEKRSAVLCDLADAIEASAAQLLAANARDLAVMERTNPLYDRLLLSEDRLRGIAADMRKVAALPSPLGKVLADRTLANGLRLRKVTVPFGVIGVIYEARPNVTFDVFSLCFKSGNVTILKGGRDADNSNRAAADLIRRTLAAHGVDAAAVTLLPATHDAARALLEAVGFVDLVIPRGGRKLIDFVRDHARVPCIETGAGVVDLYLDATAELELAIPVIRNAKTRRVSVCNALDCLIVHKSRLADLPAIAAAMPEVKFFADSRAYAALDGRLPSGRLEQADSATFGTEFMDYKLAIKTVDSLDAALEHIATYGSGHSESILTADPAAAERFQREVDAACVYVNAPTSFTDGAQFGLGAEIGISTQKLGARGPMALAEITTYKWRINGPGQLRPCGWLSLAHKRAVEERRPIIPKVKRKSWMIGEVVWLTFEITKSRICFGMKSSTKQFIDKTKPHNKE